MILGTFPTHQSLGSETIQSTQGPHAAEKCHSMRMVHDTQRETHTEPRQMENAARAGPGIRYSSTHTERLVGLCNTSCKNTNQPPSRGPGRRGTSTESQGDLCSQLLPLEAVGTCASGLSPGVALGSSWKGKEVRFWFVSHDQHLGVSPCTKAW